MRRTIVLLVLFCVVLAAILIGCGHEPGQREFERAIREMKEGNYVRAKALFENSINKRPGSKENVWAYNGLGIVGWHLGQLTDSIDCFADAHRLNPDLLEPTYNLAVLKFKSGDMVGASVLLEEAALVDMDDPRALEFLGYLHRANKEWAQARRALYEALGRASQSPRVLTALALVELNMEGAEAAVTYLMQALESDPSYGPALYNLALICRDELHDPEQAKGYFELFLKTSPEGKRAEIARLAVRGSVPKKKKEPKPEKAGAVKPVKAATPPPPKEKAPAKVVKPAKEKEPAKKVEKKSESKPELAPPKKEVRTPEDLLKEAVAESENGAAGNALDLFLQAAAEADKQGNDSLREKALKTAVETCFDQGQAHFAYGQYQLEKKDAAGALSSFKQASVLSADWAEAQSALAQAALEAEEFDVALIALKKLVKLQPGDADALWMLATLYEEEMDLTEAASKAYHDFQRLFPGDTRALKARNKLKSLQVEDEEPKVEPAEARRNAPATTEVSADLKKEAQRRRRAGQIPDRRLKLKKPRVKNTRAAIQAYNRGTIYQAREDWDRAIYYYRRSCENDDGFAQAFYNLGTVYRMNGDIDLAKDAYLRAVNLQNDMTNGRYNLALIYWELKEYTAAEEQARNVLFADPQHQYAHYLLGMIYARDERTYDRAIKHYNAFLKQAPKDPAAPAVKKWIEAH